MHEIISIKLVNINGMDLDNGNEIIPAPLQFPTRFLLKVLSGGEYPKGRNSPVEDKMPRKSCRQVAIKNIQKIAVKRCQCAKGGLFTVKRVKLNDFAIADLQI